MTDIVVKQNTQPQKHKAESSVNFSVSQISGIQILLSVARSWALSFRTRLWKTQNHLCFDWHIICFLKCKTKTFAKGCAKLLYLQKWHKSEFNSLCTCTLHSHLQQKSVLSYGTEKNTSFNRQLSISTRFTRVTPEWANIAQVKTLLLKLKQV